MIYEKKEVHYALEEAQTKTQTERGHGLQKRVMVQFIYHRKITDSCWKHYSTEKSSNGAEESDSISISL